MALLVVNAFLQLADGATTTVILLAGGAEANPVSAAMMDRMGIGGWILLKTFLGLALAACILLVAGASRREVRFANRALTAFTAFMGFVLVNNAAIIAVHVA